jgi:Ca2+-binding EF-hand superfamily protein
VYQLRLIERCASLPVADAISELEEAALEEAITLFQNYDDDFDGRLDEVEFAALLGDLEAEEAPELAADEGESVADVAARRAASRMEAAQRHRLSFSQADVVSCGSIDLNALVLFLRARDQRVGGGGGGSGGGGGGVPRALRPRDAYYHNAALGRDAASQGSAAGLKGSGGAAAAARSCEPRDGKPGGAALLFASRGGGGTAGQQGGGWRGGAARGVAASGGGDKAGALRALVSGGGGGGVPAESLSGADASVAYEALLIASAHSMAIRPEIGIAEDDALMRSVTYFEQFDSGRKGFLRFEEFAALYSTARRAASISAAATMVKSDVIEKWSAAGTAAWASKQGVQRAAPDAPSAASAQLAKRWLARVRSRLASAPAAAGVLQGDGGVDDGEGEEKEVEEEKEEGEAAPAPSLRLVEVVPLHEVREVFDVADLDGNGALDFNEFVALVGSGALGDAPGGDGGGGGGGAKRGGSDSARARRAADLRGPMTLAPTAHRRLLLEKAPS